MDGKWQTGSEQVMLMRIVALLLALADLADEAASRSPSVRRLVLSYLWQADDVARLLLHGGSSHAAGHPSRSAATTAPHDPADAMTLAVSLRAIALVLGSMAARIRRSATMGGQPCDDGTNPLLSKSPFAAVELCDTS